MERSTLTELQLSIIDNDVRMPLPMSKRPNNRYLSVLGYYLLNSSPPISFKAKYRGSGSLNSHTIFLKQQWNSSSGTSMLTMKEEFARKPLLIPIILPVALQVHPLILKSLS